jgi:hypothetical protein
VVIAPVTGPTVGGYRPEFCGCLLVGLFGACVYGVTTILPLFYQHLLGYDATAAGAAKRAYSLLQSTPDGPAQLWSYVDDFRFMAFLCGGCVLVVMLLKRTKASAEPAG